VADVSIQASPTRLSLRVNLEAIVAGIGPEHQDTKESLQAAHYANLRTFTPDELSATFVPMQDTFLAGIDIRDADGVPLAAKLHSVNIPSIGDIRLPRDSLIVLHIPEASRGFSWQWDKQFGALIIRDENPKGFSQLLSAGQRSDVISLDNVQPPPLASSFARYVSLGIEHIIPKGLDHILFVVGLFLLAPAFYPILCQVSMFTLAHTITLALGITGTISLSPTIVEPLIALSITIICLENLFHNRIRKTRLLLVFLFGLLHGLGFAGVLGEVGLPANLFISSLIAFNIGVEIGQLLVVFACFATVGWRFRYKPWYRTVVTIPASLLIGTTGLFWSMQRVGAIS